MKINSKRMIAFLLSVLIILSSYVPVFATDSSETLVYSKTKNSGYRDEVCTSLDGTSAEEYYTGDYIYDNLDDLSGDDLYDALHDLMTDTHKKISSYDDCRYKANQTDCEGESGNVVLIYTSYSATMNQWNGWNREHIWPQSLGGNNTRGGGADLHHIRPSDAVVNSTRGNKKYGEVDGGNEVYGKDPAIGCLGGNADGYFEPLDNVKGDVARIILYVWVRWGSDWGADSVTEVFQSVDVLLEWCELDPVDTWEMGRNEVIEAYQGNRNVFIDYPEFAWLLFDRAIPTEMDTPSGMASGGTTCPHADWDILKEKPASCTEDGYTGDKYCYDCERTVRKGKVIPATNHQNSELRGIVTATCAAEGYSGDKYCFDCEKIVVTGSSVPKTDAHSYGDWQDHDGKCERRCSVCSAVESMTVDMIVDGVQTDAEKILLLLALGISDSLIFGEITK